MLVTAQSARADDALRLHDGLPEPTRAAAAAPQSATVVIFALASLILVLFAFFAATGRRSRRKIRALDAALVKSSAELDRARAMLRSDSQIVICWDRPDATPVIDGCLDSEAGEAQPSNILDFASWLEPHAAVSVGEAKERLLKSGSAFSMTVVDHLARRLEIDGRPVSGAAVLRIRDASGERHRLSELQGRFDQTGDALASLRLALETANIAAWARDSEGRLVWCNAPYAQAVEAPYERAAADTGSELLDASLRREAAKALGEAGAWKRRAGALARGQRRTFDAVEVLAPNGSCGIASDVTEIAELRAEMERNEQNYSRVIDRLATAVAVFDKSKRLSFYNAAYGQIWALEPAFLDQRPTDGEILDRLRARHVLPEQADFRAWRAQQMAAYQAIESSETVWYLPDQRALRVVTSPNPQGGVTYLYDDATQNFALASQVSSLTHVQGETLDALKEGVAVFGADGRMKLSNPVFSGMWGIPPGKLRERPHIQEIEAACRALCMNPDQWDNLRAAIVGLSERREVHTARLVRRDGLTFDCAALPLPDGATLLTSLDVTASGQCRARADRPQPGAYRSREAAQRLRQSCFVRVAHAPHQHHRLHPASGRRQRRPAQRKAVRVCWIHHKFFACAARDHRRHPRPGVDRCGSARTAARVGRCRRCNEGRSRRHPGSTG